MKANETPKKAKKQETPAKVEEPTPDEEPETEEEEDDLSEITVSDIKAVLDPIIQKNTDFRKTLRKYYEDLGVKTTQEVVDKGLGSKVLAWAKKQK